VIRARKLAKRYPVEGGAPVAAVEGIDLEIPDGQVCALIGPSGSGKTTLLALLAGLEVADAGTVELDGVDLASLDEEGRAALRGRLLGFVFQSYHLIPTLTALENAAVPGQLRGERDAEVHAEALLREVGLGARLHHYPRQLSGGEQQRVAIARALAVRPKYVFADEPTGNLDSASGERVIERLLAMKGPATLVLVTHDPALAARADRVIHLRDGKLSAG